VPKSKVRKKPATATRTAPAATAARGLTPSPSWYPIVMAGVLLLGLAYMVVYYLTSSGTSPHVPIMAGLHAWNFAIGFGVMLLGLVMAVRWR
jgi:hydrogenase-4 membrane subunit HyfE